MKKLTNIGITLAMLASLSLLTACGSKDKVEENAEQALVEQTQDLMDENNVEEETSAFQETADFNEEESSQLDDTSSLDNSLDKTPIKVPVTTSDFSRIVL